MKTAQGGVAFFDSGIGGLTVMAECRKQLPNTLFYYYGDNRHAPYGNLSTRQIHRYVFSVFEKFQRLKVGAVVVACNTVTALCVEELRKKYSFPIIGAEPAVLSAARRGGEVWVLTTRATYNSERFRALCNRAQKKYPKSMVKPIACDCLAGVIEANIHDKDFNYTPALPQGNPTSVVLGCTHYIYIKEIIQRFYQCDVYDGNEGIVKRLSSLIGEEGSEGGIKTGKNAEKTTFLKKVGMNDHSVTTNCENTNECSCLYKQNAILSKQGENVVFLGKSKGKNRKIYKQTFGF